MASVVSLLIFTPSASSSSRAIQSICPLGAQLLFFCTQGLACNGWPAGQVGPAAPPALFVQLTCACDLHTHTTATEPDADGIDADGTDADGIDAGA